MSGPGAGRRGGPQASFSSCRHSPWAPDRNGGGRTLSSRPGVIRQEFRRNSIPGTTLGTFLGTLWAHAAQMACELMVAMDREWTGLAHSSESRVAFRAAASAEPAIGVLGAVDLGDVVRLVRRGPDGLPPDEAAKVVAALLRAAPVHPLIVRTVVQCLIVGVPGQLKRLGGMVAAWGVFDDALGEALVVLGMVVAEWAGQDRPYAALDLLSAVRCRVRRQILAELDRRDRERSETLDARTVPDSNGLGDMSHVLADLAGSGLQPGDAALVTLIAVYGYRASEVAAMTGRSLHELGKRRQRVARCLT